MYNCNYTQDHVSFSFWDIYTHLLQPLHSCNTAILILPFVVDGPVNSCGTGERTGAHTGGRTGERTEGRTGERTRGAKM